MAPCRLPEVIRRPARATIAHRATALRVHYNSPMFTRLALVLLLSLGLVLPKAGWLVAHWVFGAQVVVICTGDQLVAITLDAQGAPVEASSTQTHDCVLANTPGDLAQVQFLAGPSHHALPRLVGPRAALAPRPPQARSGWSRAPPSA